MTGRREENAGQVAALDGVGERHIGAEALAADHNALGALGPKLGGLAVEQVEHLGIVKLMFSQPPNDQGNDGSTVF